MLRPPCDGSESHSVWQQFRSLERQKRAGVIQHLMALFLPRNQCRSINASEETMRRKVLSVSAVSLALIVGLTFACGRGAVFVTSADAQGRTVSHGNFTASSRVTRLDENTWSIGVEALLPPPDPGSAVIVANKSFKLPPNGTITKLQGTFGFVAPFGNTSYTSCIQPNAALVSFL